MTTIQYAMQYVHPNFCIDTSCRPSVDCCLSDCFPVQGSLGAAQCNRECNRECNGRHFIGSAVRDRSHQCNSPLSGAFRISPHIAEFKIILTTSRILYIYVEIIGGTVLIFVQLATLYYKEDFQSKLCTGIISQFSTFN